MSVLVIGGAGFIGANVAERHLQRGERVCVFDNLSRRGARENLLWLESRHEGRLRVVLGDAAREGAKLQREVEAASRIYHLAGQVAVTTSIRDPVADHEANLGSTLQLLEAMRRCGSEAPLLFSSTNKVYGSLDEVGVCMREGRWDYADQRPGVDETARLDFHSPYGCSKGAADQYILDYGRVFGVRAIVFRQSCIYGPRQFGVTDQGWIVHFILAAALGRPVIVYGDGRQVRDALFVDDLLDAYDAAAERAAELTGRAFNIGGGRANSLSILWLLDYLEKQFGERLDSTFRDWRQGDQRVFIADNSRLGATLGWQPRVSLEQGLGRTIEFVKDNLGLFRGALA